MKTKFVLPIIAVAIIMVSGFFVYVSFINNSSMQHHTEINLPRPDDRFRTEGMKWEWNDYVYDINEEINFTVSRYADFCGDVFSARIMNSDWSNTFWQESVKSRCNVEDDYDELINNGDFSALVTADFPSEKLIKLTKEGLYVLRVESQDRGYGALEGHFVVKNKTISHNPPGSLRVPQDPISIIINGSNAAQVIPIKRGETKDIGILITPQIPITISSVTLESYFGSACDNPNSTVSCPGKNIVMELSDTSLTSQKEIALTVIVPSNMTMGQYGYKIVTKTTLNSPHYDEPITVENSIRFDLLVE